MVDPVDRLAETVRTEGARILATLVRTAGSLPVAEDAVQDAIVSALREWPRSGIPSEPRAWLTVVARRKAIDALRREATRGAKERDSADLRNLATADLPSDAAVRDDQLRLIFTCCHPALAIEAQMALALRTLCGLSTAQIAAVLLITESAMAKRLTRTRQKIVAARIPYRIPAPAELPTRLTAVCGVIHALYTTGHAPITGAAVVDVDVCAEAIRLGRLVVELLPDEPQPAAVLALLLLTDARRRARADDAGDVVLLSDQDRSLWDREQIVEGYALLDSSLRRSRGIADPYQLQAAIAAEHARSPSYAETDWREIVRLYDLILGVAPSTAVELNRAVAVAEAAGADAGLAALTNIAPSPRWHAVRGELLARQGRYAEAAEATTAALAGELTAPERRYRQRRLADWAARA